ncbi:MAG: PEGA domain-containing protein [Clostridium sp.]
MNNKKLIGASLAGVMAISTVSATVEAVEDVKVAEASVNKLVNDVHAKIEHITYSLKKNYLGLKNVGQWQSYIKEAKELNAKLPKGSSRDKYAARIDRADALINAAARVNKVEQSMEVNANVIKNVPQWHKYIELAKEDLTKVDLGVFKSQYNELLERVADRSEAMEVIKTEYTNSYKKVDTLVQEAKKLLGTDKEAAKKKLEEAKKLAEKLQSHSSKDELIGKIDEMITSIPSVPTPPPTGGGGGTGGITPPPVISKSRVNFRVVNGNTTIEGATITVKKAGSVILPESNGSYSLEAGSYTYTVSKDGYKTLEGSVEVNSSEIKTINVELLKNISTPEQVNSVFGDKAIIEGNKVTVVGNASLDEAIVLASEFSLNIPANVTLTISSNSEIASDVVNNGKILVANGANVTVKGKMNVSNTVRTRAVSTGYKMEIDEKSKVNLESGSELVVASKADILTKSNDSLRINKGSKITVGNELCVGPGGVVDFDVLLGVPEGQPLGGWFYNGDNKLMLVVFQKAIVDSTKDFNLNIIAKAEKGAVPAEVVMNSFTNMKSGSSIHMESGSKLTRNEKLFIGDNSSNAEIKATPKTITVNSNQVYDNRGGVTIIANNEAKDIWLSGEVSTTKVAEGIILGDTPEINNIRLQYRPFNDFYACDLEGKWTKADGTIEESVGNIINIPDKNFEAEIRKIIGLPSGNITEAKLKSIDYINISSKGITDLEGMQYMTNLEEVKAQNNPITNIPSLSGLTKLGHIDLTNTGLKNLNSIKGLTKLNVLLAGGNQGLDVTGVGGMTGLTLVNLVGTGITDVSELAKLTNIQRLYIAGNNITDYSPLAGIYNQLQDCDFDIDKLTSEEIKALEDLKNGNGKLDSFTALGIQGVDRGSVSNYLNIISKYEGVLTKAKVKDIVSTANNNINFIKGGNKLTVQNFKLAGFDNVNNQEEVDLVSKHLTGNYETFYIQDLINEVLNIQKISRVNDAITAKVNSNYEIELTFTENVVEYVQKSEISIKATNAGGTHTLKVIDTSNKPLDKKVLLKLDSSLNSYNSITVEASNIAFKVSGMSSNVGKYINAINASANIDGSLPIEFRDANLNTAIRQSLSLNEGQPLTMDMIKGITKLDVSNKQIKDLFDLRMLWGLEELNISNNPGVNIPELSHLNGLKIINADNCNIYDISMFKSIPNLVSLSIGTDSKEKVLDLTGINEISNLKILYIDGHDLSNALGQVSNLRLEKLGVASCNLKNLDLIKGINSLKYLGISKNPGIDLTGITELVNLEYLSTSSNNISDIRFILELPMLNKIEFTGVPNDVKDIEKNIINPLIQHSKITGICCDSSIGNIEAIKEKFTGKNLCVH